MVLQKAKHRIIIWPSNSTPRYIPQRLKIKLRHLCMNIHSSTIYKSQKVTTIQVSINRWMDKENMLYPYNKVLFSHKRNEVTIPAVPECRVHSTSSALFYFFLLFNFVRYKEVGSALNDCATLFTSKKVELLTTCRPLLSLSSACLTKRKGKVGERGSWMGQQWTLEQKASWSKMSCGLWSAV